MPTRKTQWSSVAIFAAVVTVIAAAIFAIIYHRREGFGGGRGGGGRGGGGRGGGGRGGGRGRGGWGGRGRGGWGRGGWHPGRGDWAGPDYSGSYSPWWWSWWSNPMYYVPDTEADQMGDDRCDCFGRYKKAIDSGADRDAAARALTTCVDLTVKGQACPV